MPAQQGVVTYKLAPNRIRASAIFYNKGAVSNTFRRTRNQFLYVIPPFVVAYLLMDWANETYAYSSLNLAVVRKSLSGS